MLIAAIYSGLVLFIPIVSLLLLPWYTSLAMLLVSLATLQIVRRLPLSTKRLVLIGILLNEVILTYSLHRLGTPEVVLFDAHELDVKAHAASFKPQPFISVVVVGDLPPDPAFITGLLNNTPSILVKEIVIPSYAPPEPPSIPIVPSLSDSTDFIIYISTAVTVDEGWMRGIVRELFANSTRLAVPVVVTSDERKIASAIIGSADGRFRINPYLDREVEVPVIPVFSVIGISRSMLTAWPKFEELIRGNRLVELSLTAWFCFSGVRVSKHSEVKRAGLEDHDWQRIEADDIDERIDACEHPSRDIEWYRKKFVDWDPESSDNLFQIRHVPSGECIIADGDSLILEQCGPESARLSPQVFTRSHDGLFIRSMADGFKCLDAASPGGPTPSHMILYPCLRGNRNQEFDFVHGQRLMWGSLCVDSSRSPLILHDCTDRPSQQFQPYFIQSSR
jgi:hypothetical protein